MSIDPRPAFTEGSFVTALAGVAGLGRAVRLLAGPPGAAGEADDVVHLLLGVASLGAAVERLVPAPPAAPAEAPAAVRDWLR